MSQTKNKKGKKSNEQTFEEKLWDAAEKLRGPLESAQYKYVVLGMLFLKFASDIFEDRKDYLINETKNPDNKEYYQKTSDAREYVINDPDEYHKESALFIRKGNTWNDIMKSASQENLGIKIDKMLNEIEMDNPVLQGVMPKIYSSVKLPNENVSELINLFSSIKHGETRDIDFDFLGRTYEFFLGKFSSKEDTRAGEFYTPHGIVKLITEIIEPNEGIVYDPTCGSGGMFVQSVKFHKAHEKDSKNNLSFYAQEFKEGIWQICKMNLILRRIDTSNVEQGDSLVNDRHPNLKANYLMANPPFNMKEWGYNQLKSDKRWVYGTPSFSKPGGNYAFMQHMLYHLKEENGRMGLVLANGALTARGVEMEIRKRIVEAGLIDCMIALPPKLFFTVPLSVSLWFFATNKNKGSKRKRNGKILFIDARQMFKKISPKHNELSPKILEQIIGTYRSFVEKDGYPKYQDVKGFCKVTKIDEIRKKRYNLTPGRHVGISESESLKNLDENIRSHIKRILQLSNETKKLDSKLQSHFKKLGYEK